MGTYTRLIKFLPLSEHVFRTLWKSQTPHVCHWSERPFSFVQNFLFHVAHTRHAVTAHVISLFITFVITIAPSHHTSFQKKTTVLHIISTTDSPMRLNPRTPKLFFFLLLIVFSQTLQLHCSSFPGADPRRGRTRRAPPYFRKAEDLKK